MGTHPRAIEKITEFVKQEMEGVCSAHDFFHIERVVGIAKKLHQFEECGDLFVIEAGALLHESLDDKFFTQSDMQGRKDSIYHFLRSIGLDVDTVSKIVFVIENVGYGKSLERDERFVGTDEFKIVEDADRLEAIGAIAIARVFAYGGKKNRAIHDPAISPKSELDRELYTKSENTSINHFYEKLLKLKDMIHTASGKRIAEQRHQYMENYLEQFFKERNIEDVYPTTHGLLKDIIYDKTLNH